MGARILTPAEARERLKLAEARAHDRHDDLPLAIEPDWIDYNGHLRDAYYVVVLSDATDALMDHLGLDAAYRARTRCTLYTLEMHLH